MFPINVAGQKQKSALKLFYDLLKAVLHLKNFDDSNDSSKISLKRWLQNYSKYPIIYLIFSYFVQI